MGFFLLFYFHDQVVTSLADPSANIIFGAVVDERYNGEIHVTMIATGFSQLFQKSLLTDPREKNQNSSAAHARLELPFPPNSSASSTSTPRPTRKLFF